MQLKISCLLSESLFLNDLDLHQHLTPRAAAICLEVAVSERSDHRVGPQESIWPSEKRFFAFGHVLLLFSALRRVSTHVCCLRAKSFRQAASIAASCTLRLSWPS